MAWSDTPFRYAWSGELSSLKYMFANGKAAVDDTDAKGRKILHWACDGGREDVVKYLLEQGADPSAQDVYGWTAMRYADLGEHNECSELLKGALGAKEHPESPDDHGIPSRFNIPELLAVSKDIHSLSRRAIPPPETAIIGKFWDSQPFYKVSAEDYAGQICDLPLRKHPQKLGENMSWKDLRNEATERAVKLAHDMLMDSDERNDIFPSFNFAIPLEEFRREINASDLFCAICGAEGDPIGVVGAHFLQLTIFNRKIRCTETNSLCVSRKYRSTKLAPMLIGEVVRRSVLDEGIEQGIFSTSTGVLVTPPLMEVKYFFRPLNVLATFKSKFFSPLEFDYVTVAETVVHYRYPTQHLGFREFDTKSAEEVAKLTEYLNNYPLEKGFLLFRRYSEEEVVNTFSTKSSYIRYDETNGKVVSFFSFHALQENSPFGEQGASGAFKAAMIYIFLSSEDSRAVENMHALLHTAGEKGYDIAIAPSSVGVGFGDLGDTGFRYMKECDLEIRMYNWKCPQIPCDRALIYL